MTHTYYALIVVFILVEVLKLYNSKRVLQGLYRIRRITKEKKRTGAKVTAEDYSGTFIIYVVLQAFYWIFCMMGLMSSQYLLFAMILMLGIIPKRKLWLLRIDSAISIGLLLFIMLNKYHFHIDIYHLIFS